MSYFAPPRPRLFGHRGAAGVAPENTMVSFAVAAALGAAYLELDVRATKDGTVVVLHDPTLERTTDGTGRVSDRDWEEVSALDAGYRFGWDGSHFPYRGQGVRIPTLESVLRAFPDRRFNIEIKQGTPSIVSSVVELLDRAGAEDRTLLAAEDDSIMREIRAAAGARIDSGISAGEASEFVDRASRDDWRGYVPPGRALQVPAFYAGIEVVSAASVAAAHRFGIEVHVWTVNERAEVDRLLDLGVDGIMSDLPGMAAVAIAERA
jgi:glycerophosphoryl diester phosphodiesterase